MVVNLLRNQVVSLTGLCNYEGRDYKTKFEWPNVETKDGQFTLDPSYKFYSHTNFRLSTYIYHAPLKPNIKKIAEEIRIEYIKNENDIRLEEAEFINSDTLFLRFFNIYDTPT